MNTTIRNLLKTWYVAYDPYTDLFQMYDGRVFDLPKNSIIEKTLNNIRLVYSKDSSKPLLIEIKNAYNELGDVDSLKKSEIINLVEPIFLQTCTSI